MCSRLCAASSMQHKKKIADCSRFFLLSIILEQSPLTEHGLFIIPGRASAGESIEAYVAGVNDSNKIQYSFAPTTSGFSMPHIIRAHNDRVFIGEIASGQGVLWQLEIQVSSVDF